MNHLLEYAINKGDHQFITEADVVSPPALWILDSKNDKWTLGMKTTQPFEPRGVRGEFAFNVLCNGRETGEIASRIEKRGNHIRIFTATGWKKWTGQSFI